MSKWCQKLRRGSRKGGYAVDGLPATVAAVACAGESPEVSWVAFDPVPDSVEAQSNFGGGGWLPATTLGGGATYFEDTRYGCAAPEYTVQWRVRGVWGPNAGPWSNVVSQAVSTL